MTPHIALSPRHYPLASSLVALALTGALAFDLSLELKTGSPNPRTPFSPQPNELRVETEAQFVWKFLVLLQGHPNRCWQSPVFRTLVNFQQLDLSISRPLD